MAYTGTIRVPCGLQGCLTPRRQQAERAAIPLELSTCCTRATRATGRGPVTEQHVLVEVKDGIGTITFNRPAALNALSPQMTDGLIEATARFERDPDVRCVVIRGAGEHFMAGGDVKGFHKSLTENRDAHLAQLEMRVIKAHQTIYQLRRMPKPVLASVQGAAAAIGLSRLLPTGLPLADTAPHFTLAYRPIGPSADGAATDF